MIRCSFVIFLILFLSCESKNQLKHPIKGESFLYDSIQDKSIPVLNAQEFKLATKPTNDSVYIFGTMASYHAKSLKELRKIDSIISKENKNVQFIYTSLDFYSGAHKNLFSLEMNKNDKLILLHDGNQYNWWENIHENFNGRPGQILFTKKDSINVMNLDSELDILKEIELFIKN